MVRSSMRRRAKFPRRFKRSGKSWRSWASLRVDFRSSTVHSDTHGQSAPFSDWHTCLASELMPRIRSWQDLHPFRPNTDVRFKHSDDLFTGAIDWPLIEAHLPDMLRVVLS